MALPDVTDRKQLEAWLKTQPREVALAIVGRASLRWLPLLAGLPEAKFPVSSGSSIVLSGFRGAGLLWAISNYRDQGNKLTAAAIHAVEVSSFIDVVHKADFWAIHSYPWVFADVDGLARDLYALDSEARSPTELTALKLWPVGMPVSVKRDWQNLRGELLGLSEDWQVWTRWYEAVVASRPTPGGEELDVFRVLLNGEDDWKKGPAHVNALIKAKEVEIASRWKLVLNSTPQFAYGQSWNFSAGQFRLIDHVDRRDLVVAQAQRIGVQRDSAVESLARLSTASMGVEERVGWLDEGFETCIGRLHRLLGKPDWVGHLSSIHSETLTLATFIEFDNDLRVAPDGNKTQLPATVRRALAESLTKVIPLVLQFPSVAEADELLGSLLRRTDLKIPALAFAEIAKRSGIVSIEDVERAIDLLKHSYVPNQAGAKSEARSYGMLRNLAIGIMVFYAGATADAYKEDSLLVAKLKNLLLAAETPIVQLLDQAQTGLAAAMRQLFEDVKSAQPLPDDMMRT
jgi:hypothetical protein